MDTGTCRLLHAGKQSTWALARPNMHVITGLLSAWYLGTHSCVLLALSMAAITTHGHSHIHTHTHRYTDAHTHTHSCRYTQLCAPCIVQRKHNHASVFVCMCVCMCHRSCVMLVCVTVRTFVQRVLVSPTSSPLTSSHWVPYTQLWTTQECWHTYLHAS